MTTANEDGRHTTRGATSADRQGFPLSGEPGADPAGDPAGGGPTRRAHDEKGRSSVQSFGPKCDRLLRLRELPETEALVLPLFPVAAIEIGEESTGTPFETRCLRYADLLVRDHPDLAAEVTAACGPAPWIVRSSGIEDTADQINAGGYDSVICDDAAALPECVAKVALSGSHEHALRQQALTSGAQRPGAIPCFVQPLLDVAVAPAIEPDQAPWFDNGLLDRLDRIAADLASRLGFDAIDCEWGIATDCGFVSATTISTRDSATMNAAHTFGFGFAAAQTAEGAATATALRPAASDLWLWRGKSLRSAAVLRLHLLQARPAQFEPGHRDVDLLTEASFDALRGGFEKIDATLLIQGARSMGACIVAPSLAAAWRHYLDIRDTERAAIAMAIVDEGSAEEHAGIMFRQQRVHCLIGDTSQVPAGARTAVFERGQCFFGDEAMLRLVRTQTVRLLAIPADCFVPCVSGDRDPDGDAQGDAWRRALAALPLADETRAAILHRSEYPVAQCWIEDADGHVRSPSAFADRLASAGPTHAADGHGAADGYVASYVAAHGLSAGESAAAALPALSRLPVDIAPLLRQRDLRIPLALLGCETESRWIPDGSLAAILSRASAFAEAGDRRAARLVLEGMLRLSRETALLPVHTDEERAGYVQIVADAYAGGVSPAVVDAIAALGFPPAVFAAVVRAVASQPDDLAIVLSLHRQVARFRGAAAASRAAEEGYALNVAYAEFRRAFADTAGVVEVVHGGLIELYDATLKAMLTILVSEPDEDIHARYLQLLRAWVDFARPSAAEDRDHAVLDRFDVWLQAWMQSPMPEDFSIEDRNWKIEFEEIVASDDASPAYANAHVVHNLIHQWLLAGNAIPASILPSRIRRLQAFCSTFSSRSTKVLRFERGLFEIEIPMGTHKASFVFTPRAISVEWSEPPDCPDDEIARLLAFEVALERYREWMYGSLRVRSEKVIGTWTLYARIAAPEPDGWRWEDFGGVVAAVRFLFDSSYDFSYVANEAVDGFPQRLRAPVWKSIFGIFIAYRSVLEDGMQYVPLHTHPMSSTISSIAQMGAVRGMFPRCHRRGFAASCELVASYARWLDSSADSARWGRRYEMLRQACFYIAAAWPREALDMLASADRFHIGHDLIAACLFRRADLHDALRASLREVPPSLDGLHGLVARHAPECVVHADADPGFILALVETPSGFRRAKHVLLTHVGGLLDEAALERLIRDMDTVPIAADPAQEQRIARAIEGIGPRYRFALEKGVDWATIDTWRARHDQGDVQPHR